MGQFFKETKNHRTKSKWDVAYEDTSSRHPPDGWVVVTKVKAFHQRNAPPIIIIWFCVVSADEAEVHLGVMFAGWSVTVLYVGQWHKLTLCT
jgi:hypothetical protein